MTSSILIFLCQLLKVDLPDYEWDRARTRGDIPPEKVKFPGLGLNIGHRLLRWSWLLIYKHQAIIMMISDSWKDEKGWLKSYVKRAASNVYIKFWSCLGQICSPWGWWQGNLLPYEWWYNCFKKIWRRPVKLARMECLNYWRVEKDGWDYSLLNSIFTFQYLQTKTKNAVRKIRKYEDDFRPEDWVEEAESVYKAAHEALTENDEDKMHRVSRSNCRKQML